MNNPQSVSRRQFIGGTLAATGTGALLGTLSIRAEDQADEAAKPNPKDLKRKIKLGVVGLGGRGRWIAGLLREHGGYEIHAVADYFPEVGDKQGAALGVDASRRFSGLSGYKKVLECGVEAIVIIDVCCFYPEQARAAVNAGVHVYIAKPVAIDVPGTLSIGESGKLATQKKQVFFVDYQIPTDPINLEVARRVWDGGLGRICAINTYGAGNTRAIMNDPPKGPKLESRLQQLLWVNDLPLGGETIINFDIHAIDAALWLTKLRPISAFGYAETYRPKPQSDSHDLWFITYECPNGVRWSHQSVLIPNLLPEGLTCQLSGVEEASAQISYFGKSFLLGGDKHYDGGQVKDLYPAGAQRNVNTFYELITKSQCTNETVQRAVDGTLTAILGREAATRRTKMTMDELIKENRKLELDTKDLKV
jgi:myo-inositol 2-dehydrogenase / D-chiro-inositol 1-dehydrogenase